MQGDRARRQAAAEAGRHGHQVELDAVGVLHEQAPVLDPAPVGKLVVEHVHDLAEPGQHRGRSFRAAGQAAWATPEGKVQVGVGVAGASGDRAAQLQSAPARIGLDRAQQSSL